MRVAFQGEPGAFGEEAILAYFDPAGVETVPCRSFKDVFQAVHQGEVGAGLVPVENSFTGSINEVYDLLRRSPLRVFGEVNLPVGHCLMGLPGETLDAIVRVYSHPQALYQCAEYIERLGAEPVATYDTAGSARMVRERGLRGTGAVAGPRAAQLYGLEILARDIQTLRGNCTRFYVVAPEGQGEAIRAAAGGTLRPAADGTVPTFKTAIIIATEHSPGALYRCLEVLARRGINMTRLESRPSQDQPWQYLFFIDCDGRVGDPAFDLALEELRGRTSFFHILGSFPADLVDEKRPS